MAKSNNEIQDILQDCLEKIHSGQATIDVALAEYPDIAELLRPEIEIAVWLQTRNDQLSPRPGFVSASRKRLIERIEQENSASTPAPSQPWWQALFLPWLQKNAVPFALTLVLVVSIIIGSGTMLPATEVALPGDKLYPVKLTQEKIALAVSQNGTKHAHLSLRFTQRRVAEFQQLIMDGRYENVDESADRLEAQVGETIQSLDAVAHRDSTEAKALALSLREVLTDQNRDLTSIFNDAPGQAKGGIAKALTVSANGVSALQALLLDEAGPLVPTETPRATSTRRPTFTPTNTSQPSPAPSSTPRLTPTPAPTEELPPLLPTPQPPTPLPTWTSTPVPTQTPEPPPPPTPSPAPTDTPTATHTPTPAPTATPTPTSTATPTETATSTATESPTPTVTGTPPTATPTRTPTPTVTGTPPTATPSTTPAQTVPPDTS